MLSSTTLLQTLVGLINNYLFSPLSSIYNNLYSLILNSRPKNDTTTTSSHQQLFKIGINIDHQLTTTTIKSCAVDEFNFLDEQEQIPFGWDIDSFVHQSASASASAGQAQAQSHQSHESQHHQIQAQAQSAHHQQEIHQTNQRSSSHEQFSQHQQFQQEVGLNQFNQYQVQPQYCSSIPMNNPSYGTPLNNNLDTAYNKFGMVGPVLMNHSNVVEEAEADEEEIDQGRNTTNLTASQYYSTESSSLSSSSYSNNHHHHQVDDFETTLDEELTFINRPTFPMFSALQSSHKTIPLSPPSNPYSKSALLPYKHITTTTAYHDTAEADEDEEEDEEDDRCFDNVTDGFKFDMNFSDMHTIFTDYLKNNNNNNTKNEIETKVKKEGQDIRPFEMPLPLQETTTTTKQIKPPALKTKKSAKKQLTKSAATILADSASSSSSSLTSASSTANATTLAANILQQKFACPHCDAVFKVKGYLTRHLKKHTDAKAFMCPFHSSTAPPAAAMVLTSTQALPPSSSSSDATTSLSSSSSSSSSSMHLGTNCHPTGGFSRRDTFKTHLKALHFIYPPGTKSNSRSEVGGRCAGCFKFFENNSIWLTQHIESNSCPNMLHRC